MHAPAPSRWVTPLVLFVLATLMVAALASWLPLIRIGLPLQPIAALLAFAALPFGLGAIRAFSRAGTTVDPRDPARASQLVTGGVYRWSRNPMYLAITLLLTAQALWLGALSALLVVPLFVAWLNRYQIGPEEAALASRFGEQYANYVRSTRRWL